MSSVNFDVELFEQRLANLKDTQEGIQQMSSWCLQQRAHHKKIVNSWLTVLKQIRVEQRLTLFYLANDVIQYSKRKNYEFVESWGTALQKATTMVRDEKVRKKIFRIFKIWEQREIYSEEYLSDLHGLLSMNPTKKIIPTSENLEEYQNSALITNLRQCVQLEASTDKSFKVLPKSAPYDSETIKNNLKDRTHTEEVQKEIKEYVNALENYLKSLKAEIKSRKSLIHNLQQADGFYNSQKGEVKVVVSAYKNFGSRMKVMKKKLDEMSPNLPSPIPSPDINAPSPEQDADIVLPGEINNISSSLFRNNSNGYTSYMDGNLPFDINDFKSENANNSYDEITHGTQPIKVISNRLEEKALTGFELSAFFKATLSEPYNERSLQQTTSLTSDYTPSPSTQNPLGYRTPQVLNMSYSSAETSPRVPTYNTTQPTNQNYQSPQVSSDTYSMQQSNFPSHMENYSSIDAAYTSDSTYHTNSSNSNYNPHIPLMPPPPMPPSLDLPNDDFNESWNLEMSWTSLNSSDSFSQSSQIFDNERINSNIIACVERSDTIEHPQDVDQRELLPPGIPLSPLHSKDKSRFVDVDHRNLISLTGSPGPKLQDTSKTKDLGWMNVDKNLSFYSKENFSSDSDYRTTTLLELPKEPSPFLPETYSKSENVPPLKPPSLAIIKDLLTSPKTDFDEKITPPCLNIEEKIHKEKSTKSFARAPNVKNPDGSDNVESIDMEMSDEDPEELKDNSFGKHKISNENKNNTLDENIDEELKKFEAELNHPTFETTKFSPVQNWDKNVRPKHQNYLPEPPPPGEVQKMWRQPHRFSLPSIRIPGNQPYPRGNFINSPMGPNPQLRHNFRGPLMRPRGVPPPYFRGRGGLINKSNNPMSPFRPNFRGKSWQ